MLGVDGSKVGVVLEGRLFSCSAAHLAATSSPRAEHSSAALSNCFCNVFVSMFIGNKFEINFCRREICLFAYTYK